jgi:pimeloyl-ACP methyl ester carboxylesterase
MTRLDSERRPSVVFVHGANHGGWCWTLVVDSLAKSGIQSHVVELPLDTFENDCRAVRDSLQRAKTAGPVLLVGHSYGGLPISTVGGAADGLVYVSARMPLEGESPSEMTPHWTYPSFRSAGHVRPDGATVLGPEASALLYNTTSASLSRVASDRWRPMSSRVPDGPFPEPAWATTSSLYVVCAQDRAVRVEAQRIVAELADDMVEIDCDHSPFFSAPEELAAVIYIEVAAMCSRTEASTGRIRDETLRGGRGSEQPEGVG